MVQLILDTDGYNITLPESIRGGYTAELRPLSTEVEMVTGRLVRELRGSVWYVTYQYGFFADETKNAVISACEKGRASPIRCAFLPPNSGGALTYGDFFVTFRYPKFMWSRVSELGPPSPLWADFSMELREVKPHD